MVADGLFSLDIDIRFRDLDAMGHVNNAVMFTYFEEGRKHFFFRSFKAAALKDFNFILASQSCDYLRPVKLEDNVRLWMWVGDIGKKSFSLSYRLTASDDRETVFARGKSVQVCYDYSSGSSIPVPEKMRAVLEQYRQPA